MSWAKLDDNFHSHPKTYLVGLDGCGLFAKAISYCAHYLTDGFVPAEWIYAQVPATSTDRDTTGVIQRLVDAGMFEPVETGFMVHDYLDCNPSKAEVEGKRERRSEAGRRGGLAKAKQTPSKRQSVSHDQCADNGRTPVPVPIAPGKEEQPLVARAAAAALHPSLADVMAIAQEAGLHPEPRSVLSTIEARPGADHVVAARDAVADMASGRRSTRHFHVVLRDCCDDQAKTPTQDRRSERDRRAADDLAAMQRLMGGTDAVGA